MKTLSDIFAVWRSEVDSWIIDGRRRRSVVRDAVLVKKRRRFCPTTRTSGGPGCKGLDHVSVDDVFDEIGGRTIIA
jgi:hypothetical protein